MNIDRETADKYQGLFNYLNDQYDINPTIEGMNDLIAEVDKTKQLLIHSVGSSFKDWRDKNYVKNGVIFYKNIHDKKTYSADQIWQTYKDLKKSL